MNREMLIEGIKDQGPDPGFSNTTNLSICETATEQIYVLNFLT